MEPGISKIEGFFKLLLSPIGLIALLLGCFTGATCGHSVHDHVIVKDIAFNNKSIKWHNKKEIIFYVHPSVYSVGPGVMSSLYSAAQAWKINKNVPRIVLKETCCISNKPDGYNVIIISNKMPKGKENVLAVTEQYFNQYYSKNFNVIIEADIVINYKYAFGVLEPEDECNRRYDFQNILTHEFGHVYGLDDTDNYKTVMYGNIQPCEVNKRILTKKDIQSINSIY